MCGIVLHEVAGGWQLRSAPDGSDHTRRYLKVKPQRLTRAALETLAIIAYRQPVTRPEIEEIRGVDCGAVVKALLERKLIKILGKKEEPGRPMLYGTSREFLEFFALQGSRPAAHPARVPRALGGAPRHRGEGRPGAEEPKLEGLWPSWPIRTCGQRWRRSRPRVDAALAELELAIESADQKPRGGASDALEPSRRPTPPSRLRPRARSPHGGERERIMTERLQKFLASAGVASGARPRSSSRPAG